MSTVNIKSTTWFDLLPIEIIFLIFDYLSSNDIIYTFFDFSQRLNNLSLQNHKYSTYFELPTTNLNLWRKIVPVIGSQIECLNINTIYLSFPLKYFPNLKSIIISSPCGLAHEELKSIVETEQFQRLESFKIKENQQSSLTSSNLSYVYSIDHNEILKNVFNNKIALKVFQYSFPLSPLELIRTDNINVQLNSLTLTVTDPQDMFSFLEYTPNLKYLNIQIQSSFKFRQPINKIEIHLKEFHLKLGNYGQTQNRLFCLRTEFDQLINAIKLFSSSLICLSLDLTGLMIDNTNEFPFNSLKLQQFLQSMEQLKQFHLYAHTYDNRLSKKLILSQFQNEFWFNHDWSFGMYGDFLFTLPFHFDYLYDFPNHFNNVQSNNNELLRINRRLWYNVKSLELTLRYPYDFNFVKELKIKMPKLNFIKFKKPWWPFRHEKSLQFLSHDERDHIDGRLEKLTTIQLTDLHIEKINRWLINSLPNLKHLILSGKELCSIDNQLAQILNERIKQLDINEDSNLEDLTQISYVYFSNVEYINFGLNGVDKGVKWYANIIMKILENFKNLKTLLIWIYLPIMTERFYSSTNFFKEIFQCFDRNDNHIMKNYEMKHYREYSLFCKREFDETTLDI